MLVLVFILLVGLVLIYRQLSAVVSRLEALDQRVRRLERPGEAEPSPTSTDVAAIESTDAPVAAPAAPPTVPPQISAVEDLETAIGSRWMLIVGTVVLVLGVAFFVKYAFDNRWINETARIVIGTSVGLAVWSGGLLLAGAGYRPYGRIVSGGGIAMVYIAAYAAHALYGLVSPGLAFGWMVAVSGVTAVTADRQRSIGLALMAVVLAYFAPLLVGRDGGHLGFFSYNLTLAGLTLALTRRHGWPALGFVSVYLAAMTTGAWAARSYATDIYLSTEIYLIIGFAIFMVVLRSHRRGPPLVARAAGVGAMLLPVIVHLASIGVLGPHSVALLVYLVLGTTVSLAIPDVRASALLRLSVWALVALPFYSWLIGHTSGAWYLASVPASIGLYLLHLLTQFLAMSETERSPNTEILLFHINGLALFLFLYLVVDANAGSTSLLAAALAVWNGLLAYSSQRRIAEATAQGLALAFALAATSIALALVGPWITVAWAAEGAAVVWVGLAMSRPFLRAGGVVLLSMATARLIAYQFPVTLASHRPVLNLRVATAAFIIVLSYGIAALYRRKTSLPGRERQLAIDTAVVAANVLTVMLITAEILSFWAVREEALAGTFAPQLSISLAWAIYALGSILLGFRRRSSLLRYMALALFGMTVVKMFSIDLLELAGINRIVGFIALGMMLLAASFLYQRSVAKR